MTSPLRPAAVPASVREALQVLHAAGHEAWLVGGCVRDLLRGVAAFDFDVATSASPEAVLALFPKAVPIGIRHGTVMLPMQGGPLDVTSFRAGSTLQGDLAHRDFTVNEIARNPASGELVDPSGGAQDLASGRLRAVGSASDRFGEDPLRALRAARISAALGLEPEASIEPAMQQARTALRGVARERVRREIEALLLAPGIATALALLRRTGIEADIAPGTAADAGLVIAVLPRDLPLRLAAWLRGTHAESILLRLRFPRRVVAEVARIVALHPIDGRRLRGDVDVRRLVARIGEAGIAQLLTLREAEIAATTAHNAEIAATQRSALATLRDRIDRVQRAGALAIDGATVMATLSCPPGPEVGAALHFLTDRILQDPTLNTRASLIALLEEKGDGPRRGLAVDLGDTPHHAGPPEKEIR
ncbi:MAG: CCA tRNA nucleotidyltransferase [Proteobacteria bacterium]|nr:CCA tRNA nucleotidyltransferase [Pseudomonadota bacterium]